MSRHTGVYSAVGPNLTHYEIDLDGLALRERETIRMPANVQYAWPHPSRPFLYVASSSRLHRDAVGTDHFLSALAIDPATVRRAARRGREAFLDGHGRLLREYAQVGFAAHDRDRRRADTRSARLFRRELVTLAQRPPNLQGKTVLLFDDAQLTGTMAMVAVP